MYKLWKKNKYIDLWTAVHLFWGGFAGAFVYIFMVDFFMTSILLFLLISIMWEVAEHYFNISFESIQNKILDVVLALIAFLAITQYVINQNNAFLVLWVMGFLFVVLNMVGAIVRKKYPEIARLDYRSGTQ